MLHDVNTTYNTTNHDDRVNDVRMESSNLAITPIYGDIGALKEFNIVEDWNLYKERLDQYFLANYITEDRKVAVLLTLIGTQAYKVLRDLCDPVFRKEKFILPTDNHYPHLSLPASRSSQAGPLPARPRHVIKAWMQNSNDRSTLVIGPLPLPINMRLHPAEAVAGQFCRARDDKRRASDVVHRQPEGRHRSVLRLRDTHDAAGLHHRRYPDRGPPAQGNPPANAPTRVSTASSAAIPRAAAKTGSLTASNHEDQSAASMSPLPWPTLPQGLRAPPPPLGAAQCGKRRGGRSPARRQHLNHHDFTSTGCSQMSADTDAAAAHPASTLLEEGQHSLPVAPTTTTTNCDRPANPPRRQQSCPPASL
ncbi:hypothetical protein ILUMI_18238 [Ignelater luminosus]|uniref:Uncharacterized protein n=1 Tax=Ignelater luminosus TaxID=2038154 RepID=A0A8K0CQL5_IGNLU|nr:hypothetical protein ILUMI_18238 [Ignelater luminosus]